MRNEREHTLLRETVMVKIGYQAIVAFRTNIGLPVGETGQIRCLILKVMEPGSEAKRGMWNGDLVR